MRILVTGANGFIGSSFIWELNNCGESDIWAVDTVSLRQRPFLLASRQFTNFLSADELITAFQNETLPGPIDWVVHMGACSNTTETDTELLNRVNVQYSKEVWSWCTQNKVPLIYASSAAVYGDGKIGFDDQTHPSELKPLNPYGESKRNFDEWVLGQKNTPPYWYGLRFFNVYGPIESHKGVMASVVFKAVGQIQSTGRLKLFKSHRNDFGDGLQMRDFVYIKDVTHWMYELIQRHPESGVYNMGFGLARSWLDLAHQVFASLGRPVDIEWIDMPGEVRNQYQYWTEAKMTRFFKLPVNKPRWYLESGVHDYVSEYLLKERGL